MQRNRRMNRQRFLIFSRALVDFRGIIMPVKPAAFAFLEFFFFFLMKPTNGRPPNLGVMV